MKHPHTIHQQIAVNWEFPVTFTRGLFAPENPVLVETLDRLGESRRHRAIVFIDGHVAAACPQIAEQVRAYFAAHPQRLALALDAQIVPGGESAKNDFAIVEGFMRLLLESHIDR